MTSFSSTDIIKVMITCRGAILTAMSVTGFESLQKLMSHLISQLSVDSGLVTVNLRNVQGGWSLNRTVRLTA